jgi:hypothetical protein
VALISSLFIAIKGKKYPDRDYGTVFTGLLRIHDSHDGRGNNC